LETNGEANLEGKDKQLKKQDNQGILVGKKNVRGMGRAPATWGRLGAGLSERDKTNPMTLKLRAPVSGRKGPCATSLTGTEGKTAQ